MEGAVFDFKVCDLAESQIDIMRGLVWFELGLAPKRAFKLFTCIFSLTMLMLEPHPHSSQCKFRLGKTSMKYLSMWQHAWAD